MRRTQGQFSWFLKKCDVASATYKFLEVGDVVEWDLQALILDVEKHTVRR